MPRCESTVVYLRLLLLESLIVLAIAHALLKDGLCLLAICLNLVLHHLQHGNNLANGIRCDGSNVANGIRSHNGT